MQLEAPMGRPLELRLAAGDVWRTHGWFNVAMALTSLLPLVAVAVLVVVGVLRISAGGLLLFLLGLLVTFLAYQPVLRSLAAIVSKRPYVVLSETGLLVDGGVLDRWYFPWADIAAMAPTTKALHGRLVTGEFIAFTFRLHERPRSARPFSRMQHRQFPDHFEFSGHFIPISDEEARAVVECFASNVRDIQPFLLSDW